MRLGYLVVALLSVVVTVFALQNPGPTTVKFLAWSMDTMPLAAVAPAIVSAQTATSPPAARRPLWRRVDRQCVCQQHTSARRLMRQGLESTCRSTRWQFADYRAPSNQDCGIAKSAAALRSNLLKLD